MKYVLWFIVSCIVSFGISLFFDGATGKLVFTLLTFLFLCTLYIADLVITAVEQLSNNQKKIYALLKKQS